MLAVLSKPKSALAEAFRSLRSSLQFLYKQQGITGAKTVLLTSSVRTLRWIYRSIWRTIFNKPKFRYREYIDGPKKSKDHFDESGHQFNKIGRASCRERVEIT